MQDLTLTPTLAMQGTGGGLGQQEGRGPWSLLEVTLGRYFAVYARLPNPVN